MTLAAPLLRPPLLTALATLRRLLLAIALPAP